MQTKLPNTSQDLGDGANGVHLSGYLLVPLKRKYTNTHTHQRRKRKKNKPSTSGVGPRLCIIASKLQTGKSRGHTPQKKSKGGKGGVSCAPKPKRAVVVPAVRVLLTASRPVGQAILGRFGPCLVKKNQNFLAHRILRYIDKNKK